MTPFNEQNSFDASVNSYDTTDPVQGGPGGAANNPLQSLVNRTRWLYGQVQSILLTISGLAPLNSPGLTGTPTTPSPPAGDSSTKIPTTSWVAALVGGVSGGGASAPTSSRSPTAGWRWDPRDGWLEQWGEYDVGISQEGDYTVQFPVVFTTCLGMSGQSIDPGSATDSTHMQRGSYTNSSGYFRAQDSTGGNSAAAAGISWRSWGYSNGPPSPNSAYGSGGSTGSGGGGGGGGAGGSGGQQQ